MEIGSLPSPPHRIGENKCSLISSPLKPAVDLMSPEGEAKSSDFSPKEETKSFDFLMDFKTDLVGAGLANYGNTCYLNSVLQCIIHTVPMVEKLRSRDHQHSDCGNDGDFCSVCALRNLINVCMEKSEWVVSPNDFTVNLTKISPNFSLDAQEDAHEFLLCLLDHLHDCSLDPSSKGPPFSMDKDSLVKQIYGGRSISKLRCLECGHYSETPEPLLDLSLEISDAHTLIDALKSFTKWEKIDETTFTCEGCKAQVSKEKQTMIDQAPTVISLHLKRFSNEGGSIKKIIEPIEYPLELDLRPFIRCSDDDENTMYDLYAALVHRGPFSYGHYYCYVRSSPTTWHLMDDSRVRRVSEADVLQENAYILFYIKQGSSPWFSSLMEDKQLKGNSPTSVLDRTGSSRSSSFAEEITFSAEEASTNSSRETLENDESPCPCPCPCPDASPELAADHPEQNHPPSTSHSCDGINPKLKSQTVIVSRRSQSWKRVNANEVAVNVDDVFRFEPLDDDFSPVIPGGTLGQKGGNEWRIAQEPRRPVYRPKEPYKRLMKGMPASRRSQLLPYLQSEERGMMRSPLTSKMRPLNKKRRGESESSPFQSSLRSLSPSFVKRGLFPADN